MPKTAVGLTAQSLVTISILLQSFQSQVEPAGSMIKILTTGKHNIWNEDGAGDKFSYEQN